MPMLRKLKMQNLEGFRNRRVSVRRDKNSVNIYPSGFEMTFPDMQGLRRPMDYGIVRAGIDGNGHLFANLGVSASLTTRIDEKEYLIVATRQDGAKQLISGYVDAEHLENPVRAMQEELAEKILIYGPDSNVLPGFLLDEPLMRPYERLKYSPDMHFDVTLNGEYRGIYDLDHREISIAGKSVQGSPRIYYDTSNNSAQLVFGASLFFDTGLPGDSESDPQPTRLTMGHVENRFYPSAGSKPAELWAERSKGGMLLIELEEGNLTDRIFTYKAGKLKRHKMRPEEFELSEVFTPKTDGITLGETSISLERYLEDLRKRTF